MSRNKRAISKDLGDSFNDKYSLGEYISEGGNGEVYKIYKKNDNQVFV